MNTYRRFLLRTAVVSGVITIAVRRSLLPNAARWNLLMILLLHTALIVYLWREEHRR